MALKRPPLKRLAFLLLVIVPLIAWFVVKPIRMVAPRLIGISCPSKWVCVDDTEKFEEAKALHEEAMEFVSTSVAPLKKIPKVIFCSTDQCAKSFGLGARAAVTIGTFGTVIGPRGWHAYYVRHEMIHFLQGERVGVLRLLFVPTWFIEGMAYALSEDPRDVLNEPFEGYRKKFLAWYGGMDKQDVWRAAGKL